MIWYDIDAYTYTYSYTYIYIYMTGMYCIWSCNIEYSIYFIIWILQNIHSDGTSPMHKKVDGTWLLTKRSPKTTGVLWGFPERPPMSLQSTPIGPAGCFLCWRKSIMMHEYAWSVALHKQPERRYLNTVQMIIHPS